MPTEISPRLALLYAIRAARDAGFNKFAEALRKVYAKDFGERPRLADIPFYEKVRLTECQQTPSITSPP